MFDLPIGCFLHRRAEGGEEEGAEDTAQGCEAVPEAYEEREEAEEGGEFGEFVDLVEVVLLLDPVLGRGCGGWQAGRGFLGSGWSEGAAGRRRRGEGVVGDAVFGVDGALSGGVPAAGIARELHDRNEVDVGAVAERDQGPEAEGLGDVDV